ncbi:hypothetical protein ACI2JA_01610 [Alkalihalobacillus sp. NPDC078783]
MKHHKGPVKTDKSLEQRAVRGSILLSIMLFLPIFLMNLVGMSDRTYFVNDPIYFVVIAALDLILILLYSTNSTASKGSEKILYITMSILLTLALIGCSVRVIFY